MFAFGSLLGCAEKIVEGFEMTLLVKADNRKKHNSHEWFFGENGFVDCKKCRYVFFTDVGTLFKGDCLLKLQRQISQNRSIGAVTCRSIGMTTKKAVEFGQGGFWMSVVRGM